MSADKLLHAPYRDMRRIRSLEELPCSFSHFIRLRIAGGGHRDSRDSLMKSEQRSPIMTAGAWVLPRMTVGIIDVSAIRRPSTPCTRNFGSTTPSVGDPIRAVHDG